MPHRAFRRERRYFLTVFISREPPPKGVYQAYPEIFSTLTYPQCSIAGIQSESGTIRAHTDLKLGKIA
jgi:hypothetical protein